MIDDRIEGAYPTLVMTDMTDRIIKDMQKQTETYIIEQLMTLDIDKDVLIKQTQEIQRLNAELDKYRWIPVEERLPEDRRVVLVTAYWHETYQVMEGCYFGDGLWWCVPYNNCGEHMQRLKPKAWMPLPQPPKGEEE